MCRIRGKVAFGREIACKTMAIKPIIHNAAGTTEHLFTIMVWWLRQRDTNMPGQYLASQPNALPTELSGASSFTSHVTDEIGLYNYAVDSLLLHVGHVSPRH